jgi:hypothetical protein
MSVLTSSPMIRALPLMMFIVKSFFTAKILFNTRSTGAPRTPS